MVYKAQDKTWFTSSLHKHTCIAEGAKCVHMLQAFCALNTIAKQELHTVTASLSQPPVPEFPSICTFTGTGGVHSTLRYWMSILPLSIGAICSLANPCYCAQG